MPVLLVNGLTIGAQLDIIFADFDHSIFQLLGGLQSNLLTLIAKVFTSMGSTVFVALIGVLAVVLLFPRKTRKLALCLICAIAIGTLLVNIVVKPMVVRIRPYNTLQSDLQYWGWYVGAGMLSEGDYCFPSGHSNAAMEMAIILCIFHAKSKRRSAKAICWVFPVIALLVGVSRVYLMVHYASDVLFGWCFGIIAGFLGYLVGSLLYLPFKKRRERLEELAEDDPDIEIPRPRRLGALGTVGIILAVCFSFAISFYKVAAYDSSIERCAYRKEYDCQNEAKDKYEIDGQHYCKIHYNQLTGN